MTDVRQIHLFEPSALSKYGYDLENPVEPIYNAFRETTEYISKWPILQIHASHFFDADFVTPPLFIHWQDKEWRHSAYKPRQHASGYCYEYRVVNDPYWNTSSEERMTEPTTSEMLNKQTEDIRQIIHDAFARAGFEKTDDAEYTNKDRELTQNRAQRADRRREDVKTDHILAEVRKNHTEPRTLTIQYMHRLFARAEIYGCTTRQLDTILDEIIELANNPEKLVKG